MNYYQRIRDLREDNDFTQDELVKNIEDAQNNIHEL